MLANGSFVGRLHCATIQGYRAYAEKVVARERAPLEPRARPLYYTVQDGTAAVGVGYRHLIEPCMRMTRDLEVRGKLDADAPAEIPYSDWGPDELLSMASVSTPAMLLSLSHGLGAPRRGWRSPDEQRALQGALALGPDGPLAAEMVEETPFLPGGVWMCVACFAAGTPPHSAYHPWLSLLAENGNVSPAALAGVLRSLPNEGERPFVAALPQALLANPEGPLAVIGHMDLAWTYGFSDPESKRSRASRMLAAQRAILSGARVGVGLDALMHAYRETNDELTARYQLQRDARARSRPDPVTPKQLGALWMQRNDLRGYVLLGDPAARLGITGQAPPLVEASELAEAAKVTVVPEVIETPRVTETPKRTESTESTEVTRQRDAALVPELVQSPNIVPPSYVAGPDTTPPPDATPPPSPAPPAARDIELAADSQPATIRRTEASPAKPPVARPPVAGPATAPGPDLLRPGQTNAEAPAGAERSIMEHHPPSAPPNPTPLATPAAPTTGAPEGVPHSHRPGPPPAPAPAWSGGSAPPPPGAAPYGAVGRPRTIENPEIALRERAVLAMLRGDEAPRSIAVRFGLPLEEIFYWLDVYREAGRRALAG